MSVLSRRQEKLKILNYPSALAPIGTLAPVLRASRAPRHCRSDRQEVVREAILRIDHQHPAAGARACDDFAWERLGRMGPQRGRYAHGAQDACAESTRSAASCMASALESHSAMAERVKASARISPARTLAA